MKTTLTLLHVIALTVISEPVRAVPIDLSQTTNKVEFLAIGSPSAIKIKADLKEKPAKGNFEISGSTFHGAATVALDGFDTGMDLRNQHMKEKYLETAKFPEATVKIDPVAMPGDVNGAEYEFKGPFTGKLLLHGKEQPIKGELALAKKDAKWSGDLAFNIQLQEYDIAVPSYLGITVSKAVEIKASFKQ